MIVNRKLFKLNTRFVIRIIYGESGALHKN